MSSDTLSTRRRACAALLLNQLAAAAPTETGQPARWIDTAELPHQEYALALIDMLVFLGAVECSHEGHGARPVSPQAGWFLQLVSDMLTAQEPLVADWQGAGLAADHPLRRATSLLYLLEQRRAELLPHPAPLRSIAAAVGILARSDVSGTIQVLLAYDEDAGAWQLPGGRCEEQDSSPEATLRRELAEELGWNRRYIGSQLALRPLPPLHMIRNSPSYGLLTRTCFYPFLVSSHNGFAAPTGCSRWFAEADLRAGRAADGAVLAVEPLLQLLDEQRCDLQALLDR